MKMSEEKEPWFRTVINRTGEDAWRVARAWLKSPWRVDAKATAYVAPHHHNYLASATLSSDGLTFTLGLGPVAYFAATVESWRKDVQAFIKRAVGKSYGNKEVRIAFHSGAVWWNFWTDGDGWSASTPWWRNGNWHPLDTFLGRVKHESRDLSTIETVVPLPEKNYRARVTVSEWTDSRPRWFATKPRRTVNVELVDPIPGGRKGPLYGMSSRAYTAGQGIGNVVATVLHERGVKHTPFATEAEVGQA
jgi:hypothetical protein